MTTTLAAPHAQVPTRVFPRATGGNVTTVNAGANAIGKGQGAQFIGGTLLTYINPSHSRPRRRRCRHVYLP